MSNLNVWPEPFHEMLPAKLKLDAAKAFRIHTLPNSLDEWTEIREKLKKEIWSNLGTPPDHSLPLDLQVTGETKMDGYVVKNIIYQSRKDFLVTGNLYVPDGDGPFPGILNMHGHWNQGRLAARVQSRGHTFAKNGYVCLCVDAFGSGERTTKHCEFEYHGGHIGATLLDVGETLMGMQVIDNMRAVDLLRSLDFVDSERIGATGASGGGNQTMWLAALDDRIKAAMPVVSVGSFQSYVTGSNCICELLPNGLTFTEESGLMALTAPRALKICNALGDTNPTFYPSEMLRTFKETRKIYQAYGADDKLAYQVFNLPHGYWPEVREAAIGWFDRILKNYGCGLPKAETPFDVLPEDEVLCYPKGERDEKAMDIKTFCAGKATEAKAAILAEKSIDAGAKTTELAKILKLDRELRVSSAIPQGAADIDHVIWSKVTLEFSDGLILPALIKHSAAGNAECAIFASPKGKNELAASAEIAEIAKSDKCLILFDPVCVGETATSADHDGDSMRDYMIMRSLMWLGETLMGKWTEQMLAVKHWAEKELQSSSISIVGHGELGVAAVFAEALGGGFDSMRVNGTPISYKPVDGATPFSLGIHIPGIIPWGDVSMAAALCETTPEFVNPVAMNGRPIHEDAFETFRADVKRLGELLTN